VFFCLPLVFAVEEGHYLGVLELYCAALDAIVGIPGEGRGGGVHQIAESWKNSN
jgi:hypothetical protein